MHVTFPNLTQVICILEFPFKNNSVLARVVVSFRFYPSVKNIYYEKFGFARTI